MNKGGLKQAMFGAGCFWGVQYYFDQIPGVIYTTAGYSGGHTANPTYEQVSAHGTGHAEVTLIEFDPSKVKYETLVKHFFRMHDPTQIGGQGPDIGDQYRSSIFYFDQDQQKTAEKVKQQAQKNFDKPIVSEITPAGPFYPAEDYHQKFTERTGRGMCHVEYKPIK